MTEQLHQPPRPIEAILEGLTKTTLLAKAEDVEAQRSFPGQVYERKLLETFFEIKHNIQNNVHDLSQGHALEQEEEIVLIDNLLPTNEAAVHGALVDAIEPNRKVIADTDKLIRNAFDVITAVMQYRDCPRVLPIHSSDGVEHRFYMRKIGILGDSPGAVDFGEVRVFQGKPVDHLILRRTLLPKRTLYKPSLN